MLISQAEAGLSITPPAHESDLDERRFLLCIVDDKGEPVTEWSSGLALEREGTVGLRLWGTEPGGEEVHLLCQKRHWSACVIEQDEGSVLMAVENKSGVVVEAWQKGTQDDRSKKRPLRVAPGGRKAFSWDDTEGRLEADSWKILALLGAG
mmetsp:Transcript_42351/g.85186  ORF Transcript_42351/g.85186 Transcript_42351/m.85186 type:complete len:151 (-) Transcript_42351:290-742(-)